MNALVKHEAAALALSEADLLNVLASSLYPGAALDSIRLVIGYCKAAGLDPMQKPVHIVPMWDGKAGRMRDVVMPGVGLYRTQASRSGQFAGMSEPEFGPMLTEDIGGQRITFPEWCKVTVRRALASGAIAEFTAREFWMENYAVKGGKEKSIAPNAMWTKRPRGQLAKCAGAQALRIAFPELGAQATAEEMEGKMLEGDAVVDMPAALPAPTVQRKSAAPALTAPAPAEPADDPLPLPAAVEETGAAFVSGGQLKWLKAKLAAYEIPDEAALAMCQRAGATSLDTLTPAAFDVVKAEILAAT